MGWRGHRLTVAVFMLTSPSPAYDQELEHLVQVKQVPHTILAMVSLLPDLIDWLY